MNTVQRLRNSVSVRLFLHCQFHVISKITVILHQPDVSTNCRRPPRDYTTETQVNNKKQIASDSHRFRSRTSTQEREHKHTHAVAKLRLPPSPILAHERISSYAYARVSSAHYTWETDLTYKRHDIKNEMIHRDTDKETITNLPLRCTSAPAPTPTHG